MDSEELEFRANILESIIFSLESVKDGLTAIGEPTACVENDIADYKEMLTETERELDTIAAKDRADLENEYWRQAI